MKYQLQSESSSLQFQIQPEHIRNILEINHFEIETITPSE